MAEIAGRFLKVYSRFLRQTMCKLKAQECSLILPEENTSALVVSTCRERGKRIECKVAVDGLKQSRCAEILTTWVDIAVGRGRNAEGPLGGYALCCAATWVY